MDNYIDFILSENNLINNVDKVKKVVGKDVFICAMVKGNAYGHGMQNICKMLKGKVNFFGVATIGEAEEIRIFDKDTKILIVTIMDLKYINWCAKNNVSITVGSVYEAYFIEHNYKEKYTLNIHIKINTGLNRIGCATESEFIEIYKVLMRTNNVNIEGIFTHFATKKSDTKFIKIQHKKFMKFLNRINTDNIIIHACNSYSTFKNKKYHHNMVRVGFYLYGWGKVKGVEFLPVLKIKTKIIAIHGVNAGESVGYDRTYKAETKNKIAVVGMGYADGYWRGLSNIAYVEVNGVMCKVVGLVCMDVFMINVSAIKNVKVGDSVNILCNKANQLLSAQYYAKLMNTSPYEVLLRFNYKRANIIIE